MDVMQVRTTRPANMNRVKVHRIAQLVFVMEVVLAAIAVLQLPRVEGQQAVGFFSKHHF